MTPVNKGFGGYDMPSMRDHTPADYGLDEFGGAGELPDEVDNRGIYAQDQGAVNSCSSHAVSHDICNKIARIMDTNSITGDAPWLWTKQHTYPGTATPKGDYLQSALKAVVKAGIPILYNGKWFLIKPDGYSRIPNKQDVKKYLAMGHSTVSGSIWQPLNMATQDFTKPGTFGHIFCRTGYKKDVITNLNSWGESWRPDPKRAGAFYTRNDDIPKGFSNYIIHLDEDKVKDTLSGRKFFFSS